MRQRRLGNSGLHVSVIGLGCWGMSHAYGPAEERESLATLEKALDLGINFLDTADVYGHGHNESLIARVLKTRRPEAVVATKFGFVGEEHGAVGVCGRPDYVRTACEGSLKRLGIDVIDLYYLPRRDPGVPIEETVGAMQRNRSLIDRLNRLSRTCGHSPAQLALAWLLARDPSIVPIPGMKRRPYLTENAAAADLRLRPETLAALDALGEGVAGERHNAQNLRFVEK